jgi:signal transduction histidine kinase
MKKILVIEDDFTLRSEIATILTFEGYDVVEAENGLLGLKLALSLLPDLILCDIMMPGMDGIHLLQELRATDSAEQIPFVFLTALAERSNLRTGMESGANDYLTKPFTRTELLSAISVHLENASHIALKHENEMKDLREIIISKIPHEMNTPLHGILGFSQVLQDEAAVISPDEIRQISKYISISGERLLNLVKRYSYFIYLYTGKDFRSKYKETEIQTEVIMTQIMSSLAMDYRRPDDIQFSIESGDIRMSETEFETVFKELVDNAFKFSLPGSKINVTSTVDKANLILVIEDSGCGISIQNLKKIGAFQQFDRNVNEQQGSGLGLAITKLIIELNGGELIIKSNVDIGTTITVRLPFAGAIALPVS